MSILTSLYIMVARGTKDQIYLRISEQREVKMLNLIHLVNAKLEIKAPAEGQLRL